MDIYIYSGVFLCLILFFAYQSHVSKKQIMAELRTKLDKDWGNLPTREYSPGELNKIKKYFNIIKESDYIDDITWNDMGMDDVFKSMNHTWSSIGEDCLYARLRTMCFKDDELLWFDKVVSDLEKEPEAAKKLQASFIKLGRTKSVCIYDFIGELANLPLRKNTEHIVRCILLIVSLLAIFVQPIVGVVSLVVMVSANVIRYYRVKKEIEDYFTCFAYLVNMITSSREVIDNSKVLAKDASLELASIYDEVIGLTKGTGLIAGNNMSGSLADSLMEYLRMLCHVDIMKFNSMIKGIKLNEDKIKRMYELLGMVESACAVASYRAYLSRKYDGFCKPIFLNEHNKDADFKFQGEELYHPLIDKPVSNTIKEERSVLLTGSNASGKSTFLKIIGINAILAQTIYTCTGKKYYMHRSKVYSSMSLKDDLLGGESYYMVEIRALKRIMDAADRGEHIICFVDEVLRGTNTIERVSASTEILEYLATAYKDKVFCFAATHDIELTHLLSDIYANYHFEEEVVDEDVLFNYRLNTGPATSRNAIQLLKVMGYDETIIKKARDRADKLILNC